MLLTDFDALTFDCYGTLIDWESGMVEALKGLTDRVQRPLTRVTSLASSVILRRSDIATCCRSSTSALPRNGGSTRLMRIASSMGGLSEIGRRSRILRERCST